MKSLISRWLICLVVVALFAGPAVVMAVDANTVGSEQIIDLSIKPWDIAKGAVKSIKIAAGAVRRGHIANGAVNSAKIADGSITNADVAAGAAIDASKIKSVTKTGYYQLLGSDFMPEDNGVTYDKNGYFVYATAPAGQSWLVAPVKLPQGAVVTRVRYVVRDNTGSDYSRVLMIRRDNAMTGQTMVDASTVGIAPSPDWQTIEPNYIDYQVIDNANYAYTVEVRLVGAEDSKLSAGKVIITYTYNSPGS